MSNPLPENWVEVPIGEIAQINPPLDRCLLDENTEITFLGMSSVLPEHRGISEPGVRPYREVSKGYTRFVEGDVLVAKITPCMENGKVVVAAPLTNTIGCGSTEFHVFRPRPGIDPGWISRFLWRSDIRHLAKTHMTGAVGQQRVPTGFFEDLTIPVPSTSEQRRIIPILDDTLAKIDEAEEALERVRRNLDRYRASVLKAACEGRLVPTEAELARQQGRDYEPASQLLKRILIARRKAWEKAQLEAYAKKGKTPPKDWKSRYPEPQAPDTSELPELPEGWCWASVDMLCNQVTDGEHNQPPYKSEGLPMLSAKHVRDGYVTDDSAPLISEEAFEKARARCAPETGDILIVSVGATTGRTAIVGDLPAFALVRSVLLLKPVLVGRFLFNWLRAPYSQNFIRLASGSTAQAHLYIGDTKRIPVPLPPTERVEDISAILDQTMTVIANLQKQVTHLTRKSALLRQSLLKHAFSGKLVPQDPADEPASALLERIRAQRREIEGGTTPRKRTVRKTKKSS